VIIEEGGEVCRNACGGIAEFIVPAAPWWSKPEKRIKEQQHEQEQQEQQQQQQQQQQEQQEQQQQLKLGVGSGRVKDLYSVSKRIFLSATILPVATTLAL
jgi:hypothetical protein